MSRLNKPLSARSSSRMSGRGISGYTVCASLAVLLLSCVSTPKQAQTIAEARAKIERVQTMPLAGEVAAQEIEAAHTALRDAERLSKKNKSNRDIANAAYLAIRHADIAEQQIAVAQAKRMVEAAERERQVVLLQAREEEAAQRAREADEARRAAELNLRGAEQVAQEAEEAKRRISELERELAGLNAKTTDRGLVLTLGDVLFDTGRATLKPGAIPAIERLARFLRESPERTVIIEGHTDSVGTDEYNKELSQRRALAVREELQSRGIDSSRIDAIGKGEGFPVASNDSAGGRQQNRRVEIVIENPV